MYNRKNRKCFESYNEFREGRGQSDKKQTKEISDSVISSSQRSKYTFVNKMGTANFNNEEENSVNFELKRKLNQPSTDCSLRKVNKPSSFGKQIPANDSKKFSTIDMDHANLGSILVNDDVKRKLLHVLHQSSEMNNVKNSKDVCKQDVKMWIKKKKQWNTKPRAYINYETEEEDLNVDDNRTLISSNKKQNARVRSRMHDTIHEKPTNIKVEKLNDVKDPQKLLYSEVYTDMTQSFYQSISHSNCCKDNVSSCNSNNRSENYIALKNINFGFELNLQEKTTKLFSQLKNGFNFLFQRHKQPDIKPKLSISSSESSSEIVELKPRRKKIINRDYNSDVVEYTSRETFISTMKQNSSLEDLSVYEFNVLIKGINYIYSFYKAKQVKRNKVNKFEKLYQCLFFVVFYLLFMYAESCVDIIGKISY